MHVRAEWPRAGLQDLHTGLCVWLAQGLVPPGLDAAEVCECCERALQLCVSIAGVLPLLYVPVARVLS